MERESILGAMRGRILGAVDQAVIRFAAARMPAPGRREPHLAEANELLQREDFFHETVRPAAVEFSDRSRFTFQSPIETPYPENNRVHGTFFPCDGDWRRKPAVVLLHGWNDITGYFLRYPIMARRFQRAGVNAAMIAMPYHFERRPTTPGAIRNFISEDVLRTVEAVQQAVADTRAITAWLLQEGCPNVGVLGFSLGAWLGGLALCHDPRIGFGVLMTPVVMLERLVREIAFVASIRHSLKDKPINLGKLNLVSWKPSVPREHVLVVEATHDAFVPRETVEALWDHWDKPEIWRLPHGHISVLSSFGLMRRAVNWVANACAVQTPEARRETNRLSSK